MIGVVFLLAYVGGSDMPLMLVIGQMDKLLVVCLIRRFGGFLSSYFVGLLVIGLMGSYGI